MLRGQRQEPSDDHIWLHLRVLHHFDPGIAEGELGNTGYHRGTDLDQ